VFASDAGLVAVFSDGGRLSDGGLVFVDAMGNPVDIGAYSASPQLACFETTSMIIPRPQSPTPQPGKVFQGCANSPAACPSADGGR
jgi:hypothetical protein